MGWKGASGAGHTAHGVAADGAPRGREISADCQISRVVMGQVE
jgi:hypothetical protein